MKPKKTLRADLERKRVIFLEAGLAVALVAAIAVFSSGTSDPQLAAYPAVANTVFEAEPLAPVTVQQAQAVALPQKLRLENIEFLTIVDKMTPDIIDIGDMVFDNPLGTDNAGPAPIGPVGPETGVSDGPGFVFTAEEMPTFQGGTYVKFRNWVTERLRYPQLAKEFGIQGKVTVSFIIETDGTLSGVEVLASPDKLLSDEAVRIISQSPGWEPGRQNSIPVRVKFYIPIDFTIQ